MKRALASLFIASVIAVPAVAAETYDIDKSHSFLLFRVKHLAVSYAHGRFNDFSGTFVVDDADPKKSTVEIEVKTESVDTGDAKRDQHLRSPDFFNAKQFRTMTFKSTSVKPAGGDKYEVTGDLALKGVTKPITVTLERVGSGKDPWGGYRTGFEGRFTLKRSDFGVDYMPDLLGDEIVVTVAIEGVRK